jgi:spore cortex formation protein SpoVR/YcgB (stage V sporulation)
MTEQNTDYLQKIRDLLDNYVDGWDVFKKAPDWDYPLALKPHAEGNSGIPDNWMDLAKGVLEILGRDKYGLDFLENQIQIVNNRQMMTAMVSGLPMLPYDHWTFGKRALTQEWAYNAGMLGKLYEVIFNTDPALAYCMDTNRPIEQLLVIAHACIGHNSFSKTNVNFKDAKPATVMDRLSKFRTFVRECEQKYGIKEVEHLLDACHALESHAIDLYDKPKKMAPEQIEQRNLKRDDPERDSTAIRGKDDFKAASSGDKKKPASANEENILRYMADNAPQLKPWERQIMREICSLRQFFVPIMTCQVMNEGWASWWHHRLVTDMKDLDLIDSGMYADFLNLHTAVAENQPAFNRMNPYALGFAIWDDIKRICENPTEEDYKWRPDIAGTKDWITAFKQTVKIYDDEGFITQHLSPKIIRDFRFITIHDNSKDPHITVTAIHDGDGYNEIRKSLAAQYRFGGGNGNWADRPDIRADGFDPKTFELHLRHKMFNDKPVEEKDMRQILMLAQTYIWKYPIVLHSIDGQGKIAQTLAWPPQPQKKQHTLKFS